MIRKSRSNWAWVEIEDEHEEEEGDCSVRALTFLTGQPYEVIRDFLQDLGRSRNEGVHFSVFAPAIRSVGDSYIFGYSATEIHLGKRPRVKNLHKRRFAKGNRLLVCSESHWFPMIDGTIYDSLNPVEFEEDLVDHVVRLDKS